MSIVNVNIGGAVKPVDESRARAFDALVKNPEFRGAVGLDGLRSADAVELSSFLVGQLAYTESQVYEPYKTPMQYQTLLPLDFSAGEWANSIRYQIFDFAGRGKRSSGTRRNINRVDVAYAEKSIPVMTGDIGYSYDTDELRKSVYLRQPVNQTKLRAAMDGYQRHLNDVGLWGESESNLTGLFNNADVPQGNAPVTAWLTGPKTPAQMLQCLNEGMETVWENTGYNEFPTDVVMPPDLYSYIASTPRSDNSDKTILDYFKEANIATTTNGQTVTFTAGPGLNTGGESAASRIVFYIKNPQRLVMHVPMPLRFLQPQLFGFSVDVPGEYKYSGVEIRYPKSAYYMDGA